MVGGFAIGAGDADSLRLARHWQRQKKLCCMTELAIIVPCRLESTRFPRKLLHPIRGKPLLRWVAERITAQIPELPLFFAVDDPLLAAALEPHGFRTIMTSVKHQSGTDRLAEANRTVRAERVINVQTAREGKEVRIPTRPRN
ncbi:MAG TPA: hypothetical protein VK178_07975 [Opitutaceae bacterium]|nr:hypothetical protein [Opitutaceae bacterium]